MTALASTLLVTSCGKAPIPDEMMIKPDAEIMERQEDSDAMVKQEDFKAVEQDAMIPENAMVRIDTNETAGAYTSYSASAVESALASGKKVVLFFHAPWCPSCKAADTGLSNSTAPENMVVFKTDYDTNTELRKKYGVTSQHTFVSINADGSLKKKSSGEKTYAEITELF